jgi:hypothetical protein
MKFVMRHKLMLSGNSIMLMVDLHVLSRTHDVLLECHTFVVSKPIATHDVT